MVDVVLRVAQDIGSWMYTADGTVHIGMVVVQCALCGWFFAGKMPERRFIKSVRTLFWGIVAWLIVEIAMTSAAQYVTWNANPATRLLLPPETGIGYFMSYAWLHFAKATVLSGMAGVGFFFVFALGNDLSRGRFFYEDEEYNAAIATLAIPWPQSLLVLPFVFLLGFCIAGIRVFAGRAQKQDKFLLNLRALWPVAGILLLIFGQLIVQGTGFSVLRV